MSKEELKTLKWDELDVILISGDGYIDSPYIGISVVGQILLKEGFRVGIIPLPQTKEDIKKLGEPRLFWGVSGGSVDSMVSNYTALKKRRSDDDYTPGGINNKRPDRASIIYSNLIRESFKNTKPIVLGGIEASLRRVAHYDFWSNSVRRSLLFDAKADYLIYGMAERSVVEFAKALESGESVKEIRGVCYINSSINCDDYLLLPSFEDVRDSKESFLEAFNIFYKNCDPFSAKKLVQKHGERYLVQNPPQFPLTQEEIDRVFDLPFQRDAHPLCKKDGEIRALKTIKFSITTHYGCYGECSFCSIALHQGRIVQSRSEESILKEAKVLTQFSDFKGIISDVGGASANMYGFECQKKEKLGACVDKSCIGFKSCKTLKPNHKRVIELLKKIRDLPKVKKVFVASGIRYDLVENDHDFGDEYLSQIVEHHTSGQLKIAPEHTNQKLLEIMNKPDKETLLRFKKRFEELNKREKKNQFLTYYFLAAAPLCSEKEMFELKEFATKELKTTPRQIQIFTPTPSTYATTIYHTGIDPKSKKAIFVEKDGGKRRRQKEIIVGTLESKK